LSKQRTMCTQLGCDRPADLDHLIGRRGFLKAGAAAAFGIAVAGTGASALASGPSMRVPRDRICFQLYTCRDQLTANPLGTLQALARAGYTKVEHAGYAGLSAADFKKVADRAGVTVPTGHTSVPFPYDDAAWRTICRDAVTVGQKYVIEPLPAFALAALLAKAAGAPKQAGVPAALWIEYARTLDHAASVAREYGLRVGYHNHDPEFTLALGDDLGRTGYEILMEETTPGLVDFTVDLYWAWHGGADPVALLKRYGDRIRRFHVKDMDKAGAIADPGKGVIDFKRIFRASQALSPQLYTVEQDNAGSRALDVARESFRFLTTIRY
jgi:sugar phosphate isomerase/epimerase